MYFRKSSQSGILEEGDFHTLLVKRELYPVMHTMTLNWLQGVIDELEHDLPIHQAKESEHAPVETKDGCTCACYCGKKILPEPLQCPTTSDGRPHRLETCQLELKAFRSLKAELDAETSRIIRASHQKRELMKEWTKDGAAPSAFS